MASKPRIKFSPDQLTHNPFGDLLPNEDAPLESTAAARHEATRQELSVPEGADFPITLSGLKAKAKIIIRMERKGRGGKKATLLELGHLAMKEREQICAEMRTRLGCGGSVDDENVILAGDQMARAEAFLREYGAEKIVRGN